MDIQEMANSKPTDIDSAPTIDWGDDHGAAG